MHVSVIVPSYKRPDQLLRCLAGLERQDRPPDEVVVVCRVTDEATLEAAGTWRDGASRTARRVVTVEEPGVVAAMRTGTAAARGDVVAYTDDDAIPRPDWIARLCTHYDDPEVGGVGGRDVLRGEEWVPPGATVGRLTWFGKLLGNHHTGSGPLREVDVLKGVNMSFRRHLIAFPDDLQGGGAQVHFEVHVCLRIRRLGLKLLYDPGLRVDHFPAQRFDLDQRNSFVPRAIQDEAFNLQTGILRFAPPPVRLTRVVYASLIGDKGAPGVARFLAGWLRREEFVVRAFLPAQRGTWEGTLHALAGAKSRTAPAPTAAPDRA